VVPVGGGSCVEDVQEEEDVPFTGKQQLYLLVEEPDSSMAARVFSHLILYTIVLSITGFILQTDQNLKGYQVWFILDVGSFVIFLVEYLLRFYACDAFGDQTRLQFVRAAPNIVDLLSIFPVFLLDDVEAIKPFKVLRAIRLIRIFRVFKLSKYSTGMNIMVESVFGSLRPLSILGFLLGIGVILFSSMIYHAERLSCPDVKAMTELRFAEYREECKLTGTGWTQDDHLCCDKRGSADDFESILVASWWSIVTMTTVGYGDKVPRTFLGRCVGAVAMISGIVLISLPVAIVGSKFQQAYEEIELEKAWEKRQQEAWASLQQRQEDREKAHEVEESIELPGVCEADETKTDLLECSQPLSSVGDPSSCAGGAAAGDVSAATNSARAGPSMDAASLGTLKDKLRRLELRRGLSLTAKGQISLLLELFDHLDCVNQRLASLQEKDAALSRCIRKDFAALARAYQSVGRAARLRELGVPG